jgi:hypothetical protein
MMLLEAQLFFRLVYTLFSSLLPRVKHSMCACLVTLAFSPVWQMGAWNSVCHCHNGHQRTKQVIIWWYRVKTVGHMQQTVHPQFVMDPVEKRLVRIYHHSCQPTSINLGITKHFNNWDSTAFNEGQDGAYFIYVMFATCISVHNPQYVCRLHCSASATIPRFVTKSCSSCFGFFKTHLTHHWTVLTSTAASSHIIHKCLWAQDTFAPSASRTSTTGQCICMSISAILDLTVVLESVKWLHLCSSYFHKKRIYGKKIGDITFWLPHVFTQTWHKWENKVK